MTTAMFKTGMNRSLLNKDFFQAILDRAYGPNRALTKSWSEEELDSSASILSNISSGDDDEDEDDENFSSEEDEHHGGSLSAASPSGNGNSSHSEEPCPMDDMTGHFLYRIEFESRTHPSILSSPSSSPPHGSFSISATSRVENYHHTSTSNNNNDGQLYVVIKSKPIDTALIELTNIMAQLQGGDFAEEYDMVKDQTGFRNSHIREIELAELSWQVGGAMESISTKVYNVLRNDSQQLYALCLEYLDPSQGNITHMNSTDTALTSWSSNDIHLVLRELASFHAQFLGQEDRVLGMTFLETPTRSLMKLLRPAYEAMVKTNRKNEPALFSQFLTDSMLDFLEHSDEYWAKIEKSPRTLIHGDFNTRNICLRLNPNTGAQKLCAYDWELACCHLPQRDVVEFLSFVLPPGSNEWAHYIEYHRLALKAAYKSQSQASSSVSPAIVFPSPREYMEVAKIALLDFAALRVAMYGVSNSFKMVDWLPRILNTVEEQLKRMGPMRAPSDKIIHESKL
ncbi:hypothetical protein KI688_003859 [Linnemannia hyalina]|uniref:Aminoglycoside phosphotransferase domain-containing protein n=1 Tax=Linnemannia hyalina TaxID=64524 RepID=A0A9P8BSB3_9FUNG|nr:hypothetical protein KI688_003859 [Linnemannia hyalina]